MPADLSPFVIAMVENDPSVAKDLRRECQSKAATDPAFQQVEVRRVAVLERADASVCNTQSVVQAVLDMHPCFVILDLALVPSDFDNDLVHGRDLTGLLILQDLVVRLPSAALVVFSNLIDKPDVYVRLNELRMANPESRMEWLSKQYESWPGLIKRIEKEIESRRESADVPSDLPHPPAGHKHRTPPLSDMASQVLDKYLYLPKREEPDERRG